MTPDRQEQRDRSRFIVLTLLRATGVAMMLLGIILIVRPWSALPGYAGQLLFLLGVLESLVMPSILAARWRDGQG